MQVTTGDRQKFKEEIEVFDQVWCKRLANHFGLPEANLAFLMHSTDYSSSSISKKKKEKATFFIDIYAHKQI